MNRTTVLVLALVILLAHILAMHHDSTGAFALPSDTAHVNFHIARNLVHGQGTTWSAGATPAAILEEGGTSLLWTLVAALGEIWESSPVRITAALGTLCTLLTMVVVARLSRNRLVGVSATAFLVVSGPLAASAATGTEIALFTLLVATAFLSLERRKTKWLGACLTLLVLTQSVGILWVAGFFVAALFQRRACADSERIHLKVAFVPAVVAFVCFSLGRLAYEVPFFAPSLRALFETDGATISLGLSSLSALFRGIVAPVLIVLPILQLFLGRLSGTGRRALGLATLGGTYVVLTGGSDGPMHSAWVPLLPLLFLSIQEGFIGGLDRKPQFEGLAWGAIALACLGSVIASKTPGNIGPIPSQGFLESMSRNDERSQEAYGSLSNGRRTVTRAIQRAERLRAVGLFIRNSSGIAPDAVILTPWPGAMGYLSQHRVIDLLGRANVLPGMDSVNPRTGRVRADLVSALEMQPEFIVPMIDDQVHPPTEEELIQHWLERYDIIGPTESRKQELREALAEYQLVAVPVPAHESDLGAPSNAPAFLLRRMELNLEPELSVQVGVPIENRFKISLTHPGHQQIAELEVSVRTPDGETWFLRPDGVFVDGEHVRARTEALIFPTGDRKVELIYAQLGPNLSTEGIPHPNLTMTIRLLNPFGDPTDRFSVVCEPIVVDF